MIYLYSGKIGAGKSYHVVEREIIPAIAAGRRIYTNIEGLNLRALASVAGVSRERIALHRWEHPTEVRTALQIDPTTKELFETSIQAGSLVVLDEAQMIYDARQFRETPKGLLALLEYNRHLGIDIVAITQNVKRLEASFSYLANECYHVKNLGFLSRKLLGRRYVVAVSQKPGEKPHAMLRGRYRDEIFWCYQSAQLRTSGAGAANSALGGHAVALACCVSLLAFLLWRSGGNPLPKVPGPPSRASVEAVDVVARAKPVLESSSALRDAVAPADEAAQPPAWMRQISGPRVTQPGVGEGCRTIETLGRFSVSWGPTGEKVYRKTICGEGDDAAQPRHASPFAPRSGNNGGTIELNRPQSLFEGVTRSTGGWARGGI